MPNDNAIRPTTRCVETLVCPDDYMRPTSRLRRSVRVVAVMSGMGLRNVGMIGEFLSRIPSNDAPNILETFYVFIRYSAFNAQRFAATEQVAILIYKRCRCTNVA